MCGDDKAYAKMEAEPAYVTRDEMYQFYTQISNDLGNLRQQLYGFMHHMGLQPTGFPGFENRIR